MFFLMCISLIDLIWIFENTIGHSNDLTSICSLGFARLATAKAKATNYGSNFQTKTILYQVNNIETDNEG